jgi:hypothetical protein
VHNRWFWNLGERLHWRLLLAIAAGDERLHRRLQPATSLGLRRAAAAEDSRQRFQGKRATSPARVQATSPARDLRPYAPAAAAIPDLHQLP